ncbi:hypothetical protein K9L97_05915 [Candidatus Woesearchaeota archaeon]|nr:hypothetical protein [Candidatus Woesearchaeota archaeon]
MTKIPLTLYELDNALNYIYNSSERSDLDEYEDMPKDAEHLGNILNKTSAILNTEVKVVDGSYKVTPTAKDITYEFEINYKINLKGKNSKSALNKTKIQISIPFNGDIDEVKYNGISSEYVLELFKKD